MSDCCGHPAESHDNYGCCCWVPAGMGAGMCGCAVPKGRLAPAPLMGTPTDPVIPWGTLPVPDDVLRDAALGYPSRTQKDNS